MKKMITIILLTLIATHAMGQVDYNKKTDRFCLNSTLRYRNGKEINKDIIEMFKYAGNQEGKRWWTGYYVPKQEFPDKDASEEVKKAMREKRHQDIDEYMEKEEEMQKIYPRYKHLFISAPSFNPPHALSYDARDTSLVVLSPGKEAASPNNIEMGKNVIRTMKMRVDKETYNTIQTLHMLAIYTAVPMDAIAACAIVFNALIPAAFHHSLLPNIYSPSLSVSPPVLVQSSFMPTTWSGSPAFLFSISIVLLASSCAAFVLSDNGASNPNWSFTSPLMTDVKYFITSLASATASFFNSSIIRLISAFTFGCFKVLLAHIACAA